MVWIIRPLTLSAIPAIITAMLVQAYSMPAVFAQTLDLVVDTTVGTGVTAGAGDGETLTRRTPLFIDLDAGFVLDGDYATEYGMGLLMELEGSPAVGLTPQARIKRSVWIGEVYAGLGIPIFVVPALSRIGAEVGGGAIFRIHEQFSGLFTVAADVFFAGDDLPGDNAVIMFNFGLGGRVHF